MSWNSLESADEIDLDICSDAPLHLAWTCPRCDHRNVMTVTTRDLTSGTGFLECQNEAICKNESRSAQAYVMLHGLRFVWSFNGLLDVPLKTVHDRQT